MFSSFLKIAWRSLMRRKVFSFLNIVGLAIGMAAALALIQYVHFEWSFDRFYPQADQLYRVNAYDAAADVNALTLPPMVGPALQEYFPQIDKTVRFYLNEAYVQFEWNGEFKAFREDHTAYADPSVMELFSLGQANAALLDDPLSIAISQSLAYKYFGDANAIGRQVTLNNPSFGQAQYKIVDVFEDMPSNSHLQLDLIISMRYLEGDIYERMGLEGWGAFYTYALIQPGTNLPELETSLIPLIKQFQGEDSQVSMHFQTLKDIHLYSDYAFDQINTHRSNITLIYFLATLAVFILIIAWVNYINLSTAYAIERAKEVGIRKVLGSVRGALIRQFLVESFLLNLMGAAIAITLVQLAGPFLAELVGVSYAKAVWEGGNAYTYWGIFAGLFFLGAFLSGIYPAFVLSGYKVVDVLSGKFSKTHEGVWLRKGLVVFQFVISVLLIGGTFAIFEQVKYMRAQSLGMEVEEILIVEGPGFQVEALSQKHEVFEQGLLSNPAIKELISTSVVPGRNYNFGSSARKVNQAEQDNKRVGVAMVGPDYFGHYGMEFVAGSNFASQQEQNANRVIVNEAAIYALGFTNPEEAIEKNIRTGFSAEPVRIAGVIKDYHHFSLHQAVDPLVYWHRAVGSDFSLKIATEHMSGAKLTRMLSEIERQYQQVFPGNPFQYFFLDQRFDQQYKADVQFGRIFGLFAMLTILIACMGLFGLSAFTAMQKNKEISIRKVLGASTSHIFFMLSREFILLVLIANIVAVPLTFLGIQRWLSEYAFRIDLQGYLFFVPALIVILIALSTVGYHTLKSARVNPADTLKYE